MSDRPCRNPFYGFCDDPACAECVVAKRSAAPGAGPSCDPPQAAPGAALFFRDLDRPAHLPAAKAMFAEVDPVGPGLLRDGSTLRNVYLGLIEQSPDGWLFGRDGSTHATPEAAAEHAAEFRRAELASVPRYGPEPLAPSPFHRRTQPC